MRVKNSKVLLLLILVLVILVMGGIKICANKKVGEMTKIREYSIDLDMDGEDEKINIYSNVEVDGKGYIMWDDAQDWKVTVLDKQKEILIYKENVTLGNVNIFVGRTNVSELPSIILIKDDNDSMQIIKFIYNGKTIKKEELTSIQKEIFSVIPNNYETINEED